jgi:excisionase family DNA binding protein
LTCNLFETGALKRLLARITSTKGDPMPTQILPTSDRRALRVNEAAILYGLSRSTIYKLMALGTLRTVKVAGRRLIPRDNLEALIAGGAK